jgi:PAS domain S-box-containing protein
MPDGRPDFDALRLAAIVESSEDPIFSKSLDGTITSWNQAAERMFGYPAAEAIGRPITLVIPEDRREEEAAALRRIRNDERVTHFETVRRRRDGSLLDVSVTISPIRDRHGAVIGASTIVRDISGRRRSEAEVADLQRRLLALVSASSAILHSLKVDDVQAATVATARELVTADAYALWRIDPASATWRVAGSEGISKEFSSRELTSEFGDSSQTVTFGEPLLIEDVRTHPLLQRQQEAYRSEGIQSMLVFPLTIGGVRSSALVFYYRTPHTSTVVETQTGQALANLAAAAISLADLYGASDYAAQQAAFLAKAGALFAGSLEYEKTLAAVADLAVPYVADWCAVDILDEAGQIKRLAVAHVDPTKVELARQLQERYPEDPNAPGGVRQVIRTGQPTMMATIPRELLVAAARDVEHLRIIDDLALTSYMCVPLVARGHILGAVTLVAAESGRHYTTSDLQFAQDLAARAAMAIDNARMFQQASDANRLKDDFLATLSHELRTPLNAVLGYAKMLGMNLLDASKQAHAITVIERNAQSLRQIIEDVLDVSRIVSGKLRLNVQPVNVAEVVKMAAATVTPAADAKNLRLQSVLDPQVPPVSGDPDRLQQVVWNLLSNAVKFTPKGGRIQVKVQRINSHIEIVVSDTGRGIAPEFLPHLFERFRQADSAFSRDHGGLGLGLAIVRELVELHGGTVHASSDGPGTGATFTVGLPLMIVHPSPRTEVPRVHPHVERTAEAPMLHRLDGVKVLAVDDEDDALSLMREILESAGAEVWTATSAMRALEVLQEHRPDAIIADVGMPEMDGFEFIKEVRRGRVPSARDVPAAALTAYARARDRITALSSGFQMHVAKPVDPTELIVTVAALATRPAGAPQG